MSQHRTEGPIQELTDDGRGRPGSAAARPWPTWVRSVVYLSPLAALVIAVADIVIELIVR